MVNDISNKRGEKNILQKNKNIKYLGSSHSSPSKFTLIKSTYNNYPKNIFLLFIVSMIGIFGLICTTIMIATNLNSSYFKAYAFIFQQSSYTSNNNVKEYDYKDFQSTERIKTPEILRVVDEPYNGWLSTNTFANKYYQSQLRIALQTIYNNAFPAAEFSRNMNAYSQVNKYPYTSISKNYFYHFGLPITKEMMTNVLLSSSNSSRSVLQAGNTTSVANTSHTLEFGSPSNQHSMLPLYWNDLQKNCDHNFKCTVNATTGWQNSKTSFQISSTSTNNETWSWIYGNEIGVKPGEQYQFITHMKLNDFARGSHVAIEGYNETSKKWNQFNSQCPSGTDGPLEWKEFKCNITVPKDTTKIRPILNAGWSSQPGRQAVTLFDDISLKRIYLNRGLSSYQSNSTNSTTTSNLILNPSFVPVFSAQGQKISDSTPFPFPFPKLKANAQVVLPRTFLLDPSVLANVKQSLEHNINNSNNNTTLLQNSLKQLLSDANPLITKRPTSVVEKSQLPPSGDKHDYLSLSPYDWPDPSKPNGLPYIGRDGIINPEIYSIPDNQNLNDMIHWVRTLSLAYYFTDNPQYASKAKEFLRVWFLNNDTRMNPNFQYAETVRGRNNLFHPGIMDGYNLPHVIDSIGLIQHSPSWTSQDQQGMQIWFSKYLDWLLNSEDGKKESKAPNNHGTGYNIQVSSIALFLNKTNIAKQILQRSADVLIAAQIQEDGGQPLELKRTNSWSYSVLNLGSLFKLASIGQHLGIDLWNYKTPKGAGLQKALDYLIPYADPIKQRSWPYQQISPINTNSLAHLLCQAIIHYPKSSQLYLDLYKSLNGSKHIPTDIDNTNIDNLLYECVKL